MTTLAPSSLMAPKLLADTVPPPPVASLFRARRFPRRQHRSQFMDEIPLQDPRGLRGLNAAEQRLAVGEDGLENFCGFG